MYSELGFFFSFLFVFVSVVVMKAVGLSGFLRFSLMLKKRGLRFGPCKPSYWEG